MKLVKYKYLKDKKLYIGQVVQDLITECNGTIECINPLIILLENNNKVSRNIQNLKFWIWENKDLEEINKRSHALKNYFNK